MIDPLFKMEKKLIYIYIFPSFFHLRNWSTMVHSSTRRLQMFQCTSMTTPFLNPVKKEKGKIWYTPVLLLIRILFKKNVSLTWNACHFFLLYLKTSLQTFMLWS